MKYWKRIGSIVIIIAMLLSLNIMTFAAPPTVGSITIHKYEVNDVNDYNMISSGMELSPDTQISPDQTLADLKPLNGIKFKITSVQLKSTATPGSTDVSDYEPIPAGNADAYTDTDTTEDGIISWKDLSLGLYLVEELSGTTANNVVTPFIVQLPLTDPTGTNLIYDVHVYPKNEVTGPKIDKTLVPPAAGTGSNILTWRISAEIPNGIGDAKRMVVTDALDPRLDYVAGSVNAYYINKDGNTTFLSDNDYTVNYTGDILTFTITPIGFTTLDGALSGIGATAPMVFFEFGTMIKMEANLNWDEITNTAILDFTNSDNYTYDPKQPVIPPTTYVHGIEIYKTDTSGASLGGAKFKIYSTLADAEAGTRALADPANPTVDWEITTAPNGYEYFNGLSYGTYWIVETQAPQGYNLVTDPVEVIVADNATATITQQVIDKKGFTLPITGGRGTILFTIGGLLLIGGAVVFLILYKKKKN